MNTVPMWNALPLSWRVRLFRALEKLAELRQGRGALDAGPAHAAKQADGERSLWLYVSTIGELNAIEPFLHALLADMGHPALTLISDRALYGDAYRTRFPGAHIQTLTGSWRDVKALVARRPPLMLLVAEIPCMLHDAPCRFSFATVHAVKQAKAPVVLVNGWLYGYAPPSRMDAIETRMFRRSYLDAFDLMMVQTDAVRRHLLAAGASAERVVVTGNIKFDAMVSSPAAIGPSALHDALVQRGLGPVIVAGSVTETSDQRAVLEAFRQVLERRPDALLVLAPRHPENAERMAALRSILESLRLDYRLRSQHLPKDAVSGPVLVLDTMGELRGCYAAATLSYIGHDHNVLEPLAFGVPVFVSEGWEPTYPSYPVYQQLKERQVLHDVGQIDRLGPAWLAHLGRSDDNRHVDQQALTSALAEARGAVQRCMSALRASSVAFLLGGSTNSDSRLNTDTRRPQP